MFTHSFIRLLCAALLLALPCATLAQTSGEDFTIIALPDTQYYSRNYPEIFHAQTQWIVDQRQARNIRLVVGLGDIVHGGGELSQWQNASAAYSRLDGVVPYVLPLGNHDYDRNDPANRTASTKNFNSYFGPARYQKHSWYAGHWPSGSNENYYARLTINGVHYLVMALEYAPREQAVEWANSVVAAHPNHQVIVVTHSYMQVDDRRLVPGCYKYSAPNFGITDYNEGDTLWNKFLSRHKNIFLVLSGHSTAQDGAGRRRDLGVHGNLVNQILSNYQHYPQGGGGYLRILRVRPSLNRIEVSTYSPFLNEWITNSRHQFTVPLVNPSPQSSGAGSLDGIVRQNCQAVADAAVSTKAGSVRTNSAGYYKLDLPAPDVYSITASKSGSGSGSGSTVVQPGYTSALDLFLSGSGSTSSTGECALNTADPSVTICSPGNGASVSSPVRILAGTTSSSTVNLVQVYLDGQKVHEVFSDKLDTSLPMAAGSRRVTVQGRNQAGAWFNSTVNINVTSDSSSGPAPCTLSGADPSVTICSPAHGTTVSSPVRFVAGATSSSPVHVVQVYVDGIKRHEVLDNKIDATLDVAAGWRGVTIQALNHAGEWFRESISLNVVAGSSCTMSSVNPSVTICSPGNHASVNSPVRVVAGTTSSHAIHVIQLYVDGVKIYEEHSPNMDRSFTLARGARRITVQARDSAGNWFKSSLNITVE